MAKWLHKLSEHRAIQSGVRLLKTIKPWGFGGVSLYEVLRFFVQGLFEGFITTRASAISFSFFLALFPFSIFLLTIIAYIPIDNFQEELMLLISKVVPPNSFQAIEATIQDILSIRRGDLLSLGFLLALFFANNGVNAILTGFYQSYHKVELRNLFGQYGVSLGLTVALSMLFITSVALIIFSEVGITRLEDLRIVSSFSSNLLFAVRFLILVLLVFLSLSLLFYFGPASQKTYRFISPGGILATVLLFATSYGFSYYVGHFASYNKLYGSIGTLLVILLWIWVNSLAILIGFELNASISQALKEHPGDEEIRLKSFS